MGDLGSILGMGKCPGEGKGYTLQYSGMEKSMGLYSPWGHKESDMTEGLTFTGYLYSPVREYEKDANAQTLYAGCYSRMRRRVDLRGCISG